MYVDTQRSFHGFFQQNENPKSASMGRAEKDSFVEGGNESEFISPLQLGTEYRFEY